MRMSMAEKKKEKKEKVRRVRPKGSRKGKTGSFVSVRKGSDHADVPNSKFDASGVSGKTYQTQIFVPANMRPLKNGLYFVRIMISENKKRVLRHIYVRKLENRL